MRVTKGESKRLIYIKEGGITLISLVVTIIILLILTGVTLNITISQDGVFNRTQKAVDMYKKEQDDEKEKIELYSYLMEETTFNYTGSVQEYKIPKDGVYELEVWGAQGGDATCTNTSGDDEGITTYYGGKGGHSKGTVRLKEGDILYVCVGGQGVGAKVAGENLTGGYNGGGSVIGNNVVNHICASGGGATHIAKKTGELSELSSEVDSILIVAGGGGGARNQPNHSPGAFWGNGGSGGGQNGGNSTRYTGNSTISDVVVGGGLGSNMTIGKASDVTGNSAGGGGYYAGGANAIGGGGSGYINGVSNGTSESGIKSGNGAATIRMIGL